MPSDYDWKDWVEGWERGGVTDSSAPSAITSSVITSSAITSNPPVTTAPSTSTSTADVPRSGGSAGSRTNRPKALYWAGGMLSLLSAMGALCARMEKSIGGRIAAMLAAQRAFFRRGSRRRMVVAGTGVTLTLALVAGTVVSLQAAMVDGTAGGASARAHDAAMVRAAEDNPQAARTQAHAHKRTALQEWCTALPLGRPEHYSASHPFHTMKGATPRSPLGVLAAMEELYFGKRDAAGIMALVGGRWTDEDTVRSTITKLPPRPLEWCTVAWPTAPGWWAVAVTWREIPERKYDAPLTESTTWVGNYQVVHIPGEGYRIIDMTIDQSSLEQARKYSPDASA